jgi:hypothetical protein
MSVYHIGTEQFRIDMSTVFALPAVSLSPSKINLDMLTNLLSIGKLMNYNNIFTTATVEWPQTL